MRLLLLSTILALLVAGCMGNGDLRSDGATLSYDGEQSGAHQETADCDEDGRITGSGNVEDGTVSVTVTDGGGEELWSKSFDGAVDFDSASLSGASGTWTIKAERGGNDLAGDEFNGEYTFNISC